MDMAKKGNPEQAPIEDPAPLNRAYIGVTNAIDSWHQLFKGKK
jgi:hypothetical protein